MKRIPKSFCTTREAATLLGVSVSTMQNWAEAGIVDSWKTEGGHRRISRDSVDRLLAQPTTHRAVINKLTMHPPRPSRLRILLVEDDISLLRLYQIRISTWGIDPIIETAADGFDGLVKIGLQRPDLLITDLQMPHIDGFQMIKSLSNMDVCTHMKIVVVTGLDQDTIDTAGGLPPDTIVFPKPVPFAELEQIATRLLEAKNNQLPSTRAA